MEERGAAPGCRKMSRWVWHSFEERFGCVLMRGAHVGMVLATQAAFAAGVSRLLHQSLQLQRFLLWLCCCYYCCSCCEV